MPKIPYVSRVFRGRSLALIKIANEIIEEYMGQGFRLTLRQLYYQFVARGHIPNDMQSYKRLGSVVNDGRLAGLIDWAAIEDRTRSLESVSHWESPQEILESAAESYRIDKWEDQPRRPEVWIEKEALAGVVAGVCEELDVSYFCCRGYVSQSEMWVASVRLSRYRRSKQKPVILYFGDHDPSGLDMTRDIEDRLITFLASVEVRRLALNMDQVKEYDPPPNPAKTTDSRFASYVGEYGEESWELDALEPKVIAQLIEGEVKELRVKKLWLKALAREKKEQEELREFAEEAGK